MKPFVSSASLGGSISRTLNPPKGASHCPRFAGESDRRGPATASEGSTRRAVNTCPASGTNPQVFRVQPMKVRQGHEAMAGVEVAWRKQSVPLRPPYKPFKEALKKVV